MSPPLGLFDAVGVELEYMIVDRETLDVRPIADELLRSVAGAYENEVERGGMAWSNELALHVVELKTAGPAPALAGLAARFQAEVGDIDARLRAHRARLLPTAMHPWMDAHRELRLWPHGADDVYAAFDRIFDCRGHGWANLQSVHLNLPFDGDEAFGRLHAAIRLVLPILPALAASSPLADGRLTGLADTRLAMYRHNASRVPSVTGEVVPEPVFRRADYETRVLQRIYDDMAPLDPEGILRHEWVNARGAIARFDRMAIEIRVLDVQEAPRADLAIASAVVGAVRGLVGERWADAASQRAWPVDALVPLLHDTTREGDRAIVRDPAYLEAFGWTGGSCTAAELWEHLFEATGAGADDPEAAAWYRVYGAEGCLARRIAAAAGREPDRARLTRVYRRLADCLHEGELFGAR